MTNIESGQDRLLKLARAEEDLDAALYFESWADGAVTGLSMEESQLLMTVATSLRARALGHVSDDDCRNIEAHLRGRTQA